MAERGPGLEIYLSILREAMAAGEPRTFSEVFADRLDALLTAREGNQLGTHLSHCNLGEHVGACKYGDDACPALTDDWRWIGEGLTTARERVAELEARIAQLDALISPHERRRT